MKKDSKHILTSLVLDMSSAIKAQPVDIHECHNETKFDVSYLAKFTSKSITFKDH